MAIRKKSNLLIAGRPGVGKTTLIKKLLLELRDKAGGFYTEEIREDGERKGFKITTVDGQQGILAHIMHQSPFKVGKYKVNLEDFEKLALPAIEKAIQEGKIIVIDEIGKMELFSERFHQALISALDSPHLVVATIKDSPDPFTQKIKSRDDTQIFQMTSENRQQLLELVRNYIFENGSNLEIS